MMLEYFLFVRTATSKEFIIIPVYFNDGSGRHLSCDLPGVIRTVGLCRHIGGFLFFEAWRIMRVKKTCHNLDQ